MNYDLISAISGLLGTILIFFFGLPPNINRNGTVLLALYDDKNEKKKATLFIIFSYLGLSLISLSFLIQILKTLYSHS